jgi:flagellar motility protein MotE (MotC chaperone)
MKMFSEMFTLLFFSATTSQKNADLDAVTSRLEVLVASIKRRSQRLYKDTDGSKGRARIRRKIREEKAILGSVADKYNSMVPDAERITFDSILSEETVWPWQLSHGGM